MSHFAGPSTGVRKLSDVQIPASFYERIGTGSDTLDIVMGGEELPGVMPSSVWLFTGSPGTGKSTLLMQVLEHMAKELGLSCLYNSGEEAIERIALRARRIGIDEGAFSVSGFETMTELSSCIIQNKVQVCVIDSIASLVEGEDEHLHELVKRLVKLARDTRCTLFLIGHVTKANVFSGRNSIAHDVDAHLSISINKDTGNRTIVVEKNRVGPTLIPYDFTMTSKGIDLRKLEPSGEAEKKDDPASQFLEEVKRLLISGAKLSGYSHDEIDSLRAFNRSGGFMRAMLSKAVNELAARGFKVFSETIDRREHFYIDAPVDDGLNNQESE